MTDPRTLRSKKLRAALLLSSGGKCSICGDDLQPNWHADHIVPWSRSRRTNVHEMQATCPRCNIKKGASMPDGFKLRAHQQELRDYLQKIKFADLPKRVLMHVVPGGGKSVLPQIVRQCFPQLRVAWFVPRRTLLVQAAEGSARGALHPFRLNELRGFEADPSRGEAGFIATHAALTSNPELFRQELARHPYALIIDESHHGKVHPKTEMREATARAFEALYPVARLRIDLSGTLETSDGMLVCGVGYKESGGCLYPDASNHDLLIRYTRTQALVDNALVPVQFHHHDGTVEWQAGEVASGPVVLSQTDKANAGKAIHTALRSSIADRMLDGGVQHWKRSSTGKLIVVADRQDRARKFADKLRSWGIDTALAIDENQAAEDEVNDFKDRDDGKPSRYRALVTCQMAYEGLDVPSATHLICLTHIRSTPWIEQMLGRIWRASKGKKECHAFVPDDPLMAEVVRRIRKEQEAAIVLATEREASGGGDGSQPVPIIPIGGQLTRVYQTALDGDVADDAESERLTDAMLSIDAMSDDEADKLLAYLEQRRAERSAADKKTLFDRTPRQEREHLRAWLKEWNNEMCRNHLARTGLRPENWNVGYSMLLTQSGKPIDKMTVVELRYWSEWAKGRKHG